MKKKVSYKLTAVIVIILLLCPSYVVIAASVSSTLSNRTELTELNMNDAVIRLNLTGETFKSGITAANFQLNNEPGGTTIKSVVLINSSTVDLTLGYIGQDFDTDITNFSIKALKSGLTSGAADLTTQAIIIKATIEKITPSFNVNPLKEDNINGSVVTITLENDKLISSIGIGNFSLHKPSSPSNIGVISISKVERVSDTQARLTLAYDGADIETNATDFRIKLLKSGLTRTASDLETDNITIYYVPEKMSVISMNPNPLIETELNNSVLTLSLTGDNFIANITANNFSLVNPVSGLSIARVDRISTTQVNLTLSFDGTDFDADKTNFAVKLLKSGLVRTVSDIQTSNIIIYAVVEGVPSLRASSHPIQLYETSLNGCYIDLILREDSFKTTVTPAYFQLNNAPTGVSIYKVTYIDTHNVMLELAFDGTDFDTDITNFNVTALSSSLVSGSMLASNNITLIANKEIDGMGGYIVTGESYPTKIEMAGYNIRDNKMYINMDLITTKTVLEGQTASFQYFIAVYDNNGNKIGGAGSIEQPFITYGTSSAKVQNAEVTLSSPLTSQYKIVCIVVLVSTQ